MEEEKKEVKEAKVKDQFKDLLDFLFATEIKDDEYVFGVLDKTPDLDKAILEYKTKAGIEKGESVEALKDFMLFQYYDDKDQLYIGTNPLNGDNTMVWKSIYNIVDRKVSADGTNITLMQEIKVKQVQKTLTFKPELDEEGKEKLDENGKAVFIKDENGDPVTFEEEKEVEVTIPILAYFIYYEYSTGKVNCIEGGDASKYGLTYITRIVKPNDHEDVVFIEGKDKDDNTKIIRLTIGFDEDDNDAYDDMLDVDLILARDLRDNKYINLDDYKILGPLNYKYILVQSEDNKLIIELFDMDKARVINVFPSHVDIYDINDDYSLIVVGETIPVLDENNQPAKDENGNDRVNTIYGPAVAPHVIDEEDKDEAYGTYHKIEKQIDAMGDILGTKYHYIIQMDDENKSFIVDLIDYDRLEDEIVYHTYVCKNIPNRMYVAKDSGRITCVYQQDNTFYQSVSYFKTNDQLYKYSAVAFVVDPSKKDDIMKLAEQNIQYNNIDDDNTEIYYLHNFAHLKTRENKEAENPNAPFVASSSHFANLSTKTSLDEIYDKFNMSYFGSFVYINKTEAVTLTTKIVRTLRSIKDFKRETLEDILK